MTPAEHRERAEQLLVAAADNWLTVEDDGDEEAAEIAKAQERRAQVHAILALAPPPPSAQPTHRWSLDKSHSFPDATGGQVTVLPVIGAPGVIFSIGDEGLLMENPDVLRTLASLLTAHADRLESRS